MSEPDYLTRNRVEWTNANRDHTDARAHDAWAKQDSALFNPSVASFESLVTQERPEAIDRYTLIDLVGDVVGLIAALGAQRAIVVGHDWGAPVAWHSALMRPAYWRTSSSNASVRPASAWRTSSPSDIIRSSGSAR